MEGGFSCQTRLKLSLKVNECKPLPLALRLKLFREPRDLRADLADLRLHRRAAGSFRTRARIESRASRLHVKYS